MPFLTRDEFEAHVPNARHFSSGPDTFDAAERSAARVASRLSGYPIPADAADAPLDVKQPVAHLVAFGLSIGVKLSDADGQQLRRLEQRAREDLAALRTQRASDTDAQGQSSAPDPGRTGDLEALPIW